MNRVRTLLSAPIRGARGIFNRISRIQRIFLLVGLVVLIGGVAIGFVMLRDNKPEAELVNMDGITYKLRGFSLETDELTAALTEAHSLLTQKIGLPVFTGEVVIVFDPIIEGSGEMRRLSSRRRELRLSSAMSGLGIQKRELLHEIVHASWQSDIIHERYPIFAIEGIAQGLAQILVDPKSSWLIEELNDFYFQDLVGLLSPDADLNKLEEWQKLLSYELASQLFVFLDKIDPTLLPKLLRDKPEKKLDWLAFSKRVVAKSDAPDEARKLLNSCRVFLEGLPEEYYIIPLRKPQSKSITVGIFLPDLKTQGPIKVEYRLEDDENRNRSDEKLLFFDNGYSQFDIQLPDDIVTFSLKFTFSGITYLKTFQCSGGERQ